MELMQIETDQMLWSWSASALDGFADISIMTKM
jgi:hypothetical protein